MKTETATAASRRGGDNVRQLVPRIREEILSGRIEPGAPLRQDEIASRFATSRIPVREALRLLEAEGLVSIIPNKGAVAAPLDLAELVEVYEMRVLAETHAMRMAIPELSNSRIDRAAAMQDQMERAGLQEFGRLNKQFHTLLYEAAGRPRLLAHIENLNDVADRYLRFTIKALQYADRSHDEHRQLLEACRRRDAEEAVAVLTRHIADAGETLAAYLSTADGPMNRT